MVCLLDDIEKQIKLLSLDIILNTENSRTYR